MKCSKCGVELKEHAKFCNNCGTKVEQPVKAAAPAFKHDISKVWPEWQTVKELGHGSYGVVYQAIRKDSNVESHAAIKVISIPNDSSELDSLRAEGLGLDGTRTYFYGLVTDFVSEIQLMESVKGVQNIVSVEDYKVVEKVGTIGWDIYIRMELLTPFNTYICDKKLTEKDVIKLGIDICTALEICGQLDIIHRDIKPENIFINSFGHFKLGDFGIARKMENSTSGLSQKGTYNYMAPEVATSNKYDARVDTYSLGIVLYRLLNGNHLPFLNTEKQLLSPAERKAAVDRRINGEALPAPTEASAAMAHLILRSCAFDPRQRFSSASEMKKALEAVLNGTYNPTGAKPKAKASTTGKPGNTYEKTTAVRKAPPATAQTEGTQGGKTPGNFDKRTKKKSKAPAIIAIILVLALLIGGAVLVLPKVLGDKDTEQSDATSDSEVVEYSRSDEKEINAIIEEADALAADGDYKNALTTVKNGLVTYPGAQALMDKVQEYNDAIFAQEKTSTLEQADALAEAGDYVGAMAVIQEAQASTPDDADYQSAYDRYNQSWVASVKLDATTEAEQLADAKDLVGAANVLRNAITQVGEDQELSDQAQGYEDAYARTVSEDVDDMLSANDVASAKKLLQEAAGNFPNNAVIKSRQDEVSKYKSALLHTLTPINGGFTWNEGTPQDPFGTSYTNVQNYTILHSDSNYNSASYSAEYKIDGQYDVLNFTVSPYADFGENGSAYMQIYADEVLCYTLPPVQQKSQPQNITVDVKGASYIKLLVYCGNQHSCLMFSDMELSCIPNYVSPQSSEETEAQVSLASMPVFNGSLPWDEGYPQTTRGDDFTTAKNYAIVHSESSYNGKVYSAEYFVNKQYASLSFDLAPMADFGANATAYVKVYMDDTLIYTSPTINQKTEKFNVGDLDLSGVSYIKIIVECSAQNGCVIISDALLNKS